MPLVLPVACVRDRKRRVQPCGFPQRLGRLQSHCLRRLCLTRSVKAAPSVPGVAQSWETPVVL
eukprot:3934219-Lingulodinium_polyedra.AAC.1